MCGTSALLRPRNVLAAAVAGVPLPGIAGRHVVHRSDHRHGLPAAPDREAPDSAHAHHGCLRRAPSGHVASATQTCRIGLLAQHADTDEPTNTEHHPYMRDMLVDQAGRPGLPPPGRRHRPPEYLVVATESSWGATGCRPEVRHEPFVAGLFVASPLSRACRRDRGALSARSDGVSRTPAAPRSPSRPRRRDRGALSARSVAAMRSTTTSWLISQRPRQFIEMWLNRRCSIWFHLLVPGGRWQTVMVRPVSRAVHRLAGQGGKFGLPGPDPVAVGGAAVGADQQPIRRRVGDVPDRGPPASQRGVGKR